MKFIIFSQSAYLAVILMKGIVSVQILIFFIECSSVFNSNNDLSPLVAYEFIDILGIVVTL